MREVGAVLVDDEHKVASKLEVVVRLVFEAIHVDDEHNVVSELEVVVGHKAGNEHNVVSELEVVVGHKARVRVHVDAIIDEVNGEVGGGQRCRRGNLCVHQ